MIDKGWLVWRERDDGTFYSCINWDTSYRTVLDRLLGRPARMSRLLVSGIRTCERPPPGDLYVAVDGSLMIA